MKRTYRRHVDREDFDKIINDLHKEIPLNIISQKYNIDIKVLYRWKNLEYEPSSINQGLSNMRFTKIEEKSIFEAIQLLIDKRIGLDRERMLNIINKVYKKLYPADESELTRSYLRGFIERTGISFHEPVKNKNIEMNDGEIQQFIDKYIEMMRDYSEDCILNFDEVAWKGHIASNKVATNKGQKTKIPIGIAMASKLGFSVGATVTLDGQRLPLLIILREDGCKEPKLLDVKEYPKKFQVENPADNQEYIIIKNGNGWMSQETMNIFLEWLSNYVKRNIYLLIDSAKQHFHLKDFNNIKILHIPPGMTGEYQPNDRGVFGVMKQHVRKIENSLTDYSPTAANAFNVLITIWKVIKRSTIKHAWLQEWEMLKLEPKELEKDPTYIKNNSATSSEDELTYKEIKKTRQAPRIRQVFIKPGIENANSLGVKMFLQNDGKELNLYTINKYTLDPQIFYNTAAKNYQILMENSKFTNPNFQTLEKQISKRNIIVLKNKQSSLPSPVSTQSKDNDIESILKKKALYETEKRLNKRNGSNVFDTDKVIKKTISTAVQGLIKPKMKKIPTKLIEDVLYIDSTEDSAPLMLPSKTDFVIENYDCEKNLVNAGIVNRSLECFLIQIIQLLSTIMYHSEEDADKIRQLIRNNEAAEDAARIIEVLDYCSPLNRVFKKPFDLTYEYCDSFFKNTACKTCTMYSASSFFEAICKKWKMYSLFSPMVIPLRYRVSVHWIIEQNTQIDEAIKKELENVLFISPKYLVLEISAADQYHINSANCHVKFLNEIPLKLRIKNGFYKYEYQLLYVINHTYGHYTGFRFSNDSWILTNDSKTEPKSQEHMLQYSLGRIPKCNFYVEMLLYKRIDEPTANDINNAIMKELCKLNDQFPKVILNTIIGLYNIEYIITFDIESAFKTCILSLLKGRRIRNIDHDVLNRLSECNKKFGQQMKEAVAFLFAALDFEPKENISEDESDVVCIT